MSILTMSSAEVRKRARAIRAIEERRVVLWGARRGELQLGTPEDAARQRMLAHWESARRVMAETAAAFARSMNAIGVTVSEAMAMLAKRSRAFEAAVNRSSTRFPSDEDRKMPAGPSPAAPDTRAGGKRLLP